MRTARLLDTHSHLNTLMVDMGVYLRTSRTCISIWDLVWMYRASDCLDPRDRVFALLSLAKPPSFGAVCPDYSRTPTQLLLDLMEQKARCDEEGKWRSRDIRENFTRAHMIVGAFGFGPKTPDIISLRDRRLIATPGADSCPGREHRDLLVDLENRHRIVLPVASYGRVTEDEADRYVIELVDTLVDRLPTTTRGFEVQRSNTTTIWTPAGLNLGSANKQVQPGDTLLLFQDGENRPTSNAGVFLAGLMVRSHDGMMHSIVGQFNLNRDLTVRNRRGEVSAQWRVYMSPEDLLVFVAADMKLERRQDTTCNELWRLRVHDRERARRLATRVTGRPFSSYAVLSTMD
jgi:hypothetical protein